jgi:hypothetical protein
LPLLSFAVITAFPLFFFPALIVAVFPVLETVATFLLEEVQLTFEYLSLLSITAVILNFFLGLRLIVLIFAKVIFFALVTVEEADFVFWIVP